MSVSNSLTSRRPRWAFLLVLLMGAGCLMTVGHRPAAGAPSVEKTLLTTAYCKCGDCCGWKRTWWGRPVTASGAPKQVGITASGTRARPGTLAADTTRYPFGTLMYIPGYGYGRVEDRGGDIQGDHIDLYFTSHRKALAWGRQTHAVQVWPAPP